MNNITSTNTKHSKSSCCSDRASAQFWALYYGASQGVSTGASAFSSLFKSGGSLMCSFGVATLATALDFASSYCFQGSSIKANVSFQRLEIKNEISNREAPFAEPSLTETFLTPKPSNVTKFYSISAQGCYLILDSGKNFVNRYFLLTAILECVGSTLSPAAFYGILVSSFILKQTFSMTNETYETVETIADSFISDTKPFYSSIFKPISSGIPLEVFRIAGSLDHALVDDIISWAPMYLSTGAMKYLLSSDILPRILLTLCSIVGVLLACSLFMLVYLFEGNHTVNNLKKLIGELESAEPKTFPDVIINYFKLTIKLTPVLHGLGSATSVYYTLCDVIKNPDLKMPLALFFGGVTFIGSAKGTQLSEAREAYEELEKRRRFLVL